MMNNSDVCPMDTSRTQPQFENVFTNPNDDMHTWPIMDSVAEDRSTGDVVGDCGDTQLSTCFQSASFSDTGQVEMPDQSDHRPQTLEKSNIPVIEQGLRDRFKSEPEKLDQFGQSCGTEEDRNEMEEILDKTLKASYLDYNESDEESQDSYCDRLNDRDSDPDYSKSPEEEDEDDEDDDKDDYIDSEDSDFIPGLKRKGSSSLSKENIQACPIKRQKKALQNTTVQEKINRLKLAQKKDAFILANRMAEINTIYKANEAANVDKDLNYLTVLLAKDEILRDGSYHLKETRNMVKSLFDSENNERELKDAVKNVLKRHNLLSTSFGPGTSLATAISYARILCPRKRVAENMDTDISPSCLITILDEPLATGSSAAPTKQESLSGRSCLLLQQIAHHESNRRKAVSANMSRNLMPVKSREGETILESVLKSMLNVRVDPEPAVNSLTPQSKSTLLREILKSDLQPLNLPSVLLTDVPDETECMDHADPGASANITISGYSLYVDNAHFEDKRSEQKLDKSENVLPDRVAESGDLERVLPTFKIKSEPHSPIAECSREEVRPIPSIHGHASEEESVEQAPLNVRIKSEPIAQSEFNSDLNLKNPTATTHTDFQAQSRPCTLEATTDVSCDKATPLSAADDSSRDSDLQMVFADTSGSSLPPFNCNQSSSTILRTLESLLRNRGLQREAAKIVDLTKPDSRPRNKVSLSTKIARVKEGLDCAGDDSSSSNSPGSQSPSILTPKLMFTDLATKDVLGSTKTTSDSKTNTILRCLVNGSSALSSETSAPVHAYNTQHNRQQDTSLLQEVLSSFRPTSKGELLSHPSPSPAAKDDPQTIIRYGFVETVKGRKVDYTSASANQSNVLQDSHIQNTQCSPNTMATVKTEKSDRLYDSANQSSVGPDVYDSSTPVSLVQNVTSCSQQLLNIIKSVGATKKTTESGRSVAAPESMKGNGNKSDSVTILRSILNSEAAVYCSKDQGDSHDGHPPSASVTNVGTPSSNIIMPRNIFSQCPATPKARSMRGTLLQELRNSITNRMDLHHSFLPSGDPEVNANAKTGTMAAVGQSSGTEQSSEIGTIDSGGVPLVSTDSTDLSNVLGVCPYQCRLCGKTFITTLVLEKHMLEHFGTEPFGCNICPKSYINVIELEEHTSIHISELSPALVYKCTVCGKVFDTESEHNLHRRSHAPNTQKEPECNHGDNASGTSKPLADDICPKRFSMVYECPKCSNRFAMSTDYERHVGKCRISSLIRCSECEAHFASMAQLKYHCMKHHGQQGITCMYCETGFRFQIHLDAHMLREHRERFRPSAISLHIRDALAGILPDTIPNAQGSPLVSDDCIIISKPGNSTSGLIEESLVVTISSDDE